MARQSARNATTLTSYRGSSIANMGRVEARSANSRIASAGPNMARMPSAMPMGANRPAAPSAMPAIPTAAANRGAAPVNRAAAPQARPATPAGWGNSNPLTGRPMGTEGLGRPLGAPDRSVNAPRVDTNGLDQQSPLSRPAYESYGLGRPLGAPLPFGGFFAEGGVAPAGAASIVGENGPEIIVPQAPTTVIPIQMPGQRRESEAPVVTRSGVDQVKLGQEAARYRTKADARWNDYVKNTDPAKDAALRDLYQRSQNVANLLQNDFENPPMPVQRATIVNTGSAMDRHMATGLSGQARRQVGRSANDPMRIAEQQRRRGNIRPILQLGQMAMEQQARQALDNQNFAQQAALFQAQQQVQNRRADIDWQRQQERDAATQQAWSQRDATNFQQQQQLEADRRAAENADRQRREQQNRIVRFENMPTPDGKGFVPVGVRADGSYDMAGGYMPSRTDEPQGWQKIEGTDMYVMTGVGSENFRGQTWRKEGDRYVPNVAPAQPQVRTIEMPDGTRMTMQRNPQTGQWEPLPMAPETQRAPAPAGGAPNAALERLRKLQGQ